MNLKHEKMAEAEAEDYEKICPSESQSAEDIEMDILIAGVAAMLVVIAVTILVVVFT